MDRKIIGRLAIGTAAALCLTSAPLALVPVAAVGPPSTTPSGQPLTAAQATSLHARLADRLATTGAIHGLRLTARETDVTSAGRSQLIWASTVAVDPKRRLVRETDNLASFASAADYVDGPPEDTCPAETSADGSYGTTQTYLTKAGTAQWQKVRKGSYPHTQKLKILGRPHAKWERIPKRVALTTAVRTGFTFDDLGRSFLRGRAFMGGSSKVTSTGTSYALTYRSTDGSAMTGTVEASVDAGGVVTALRRVEAIRLDGVTYTSTTSYTIAYGARRLAVPKKSTVVTHRRMVSACHALRTTETAARLAESVKVEVNGQGARTAARVRSTAARFAPPKEWKLRVTRTSISGGVMIVGRHQLLKHPVVWTVFVRNGKAVAHKVR